MFRVDGLIFLLAVSRNLRHVFVDVLDSTAIINHAFPTLKRLCDKYAAQNFTVREIHADPEFLWTRAWKKVQSAPRAGAGM